MIVDTDEKVRKDLYRKPRVEYIKEKNQEELQRSFTKLKSSISPTKKTSPYGSPYYNAN